MADNSVQRCCVGGSKDWCWCYVVPFSSSFSRTYIFTWILSPEVDCLARLLTSLTCFPCSKRSQDFVREVKRGRSGRWGGVWELLPCVAKCEMWSKMRDRYMGMKWWCVVILKAGLCLWVKDYCCTPSSKIQQISSGSIAWKWNRRNIMTRYVHMPSLFIVNHSYCLWLVWQSVGAVSNIDQIWHG